MTTREQLHRLVDELPDDALRAVQIFAEFAASRATIGHHDRSDISDPVLRAFMEAPDDDEPLTAEDIEAIEEGSAEIARGEAMPWSAYLAQRARG
jgi:hypothetical protein